MNERGIGDEDPERTAGREAAGGRNSRLQAAPVIVVRMEGLLARTVERVAKFPREHKFTVGDRLVETCLDITSHLVEASYRRDKRGDLAEASRAHTRTGRDIDSIHLVRGWTSF